MFVHMSPECSLNLKDFQIRTSLDDEDDDGIYEDDDFEAEAEGDEDGLVPPLRVPTPEEDKPRKKANGRKKVNRPKSARAARLSKLTESELLPPRPHSARAVSEAVMKAEAAAAAAAAKRRHATAAVSLLKRDATKTRKNHQKASRSIHPTVEFYQNLSPPMSDGMNHMRCPMV